MNEPTNLEPSKDGPSREVVLAQIDLEVTALTVRREDGWTPQALHVALVAVLGFIAQNLATATTLEWNEVLPRVLVFFMAWAAVASLTATVVRESCETHRGLRPAPQSVSVASLSRTRLQVVIVILEMSVVIGLLMVYAPVAIGWTLTLLAIALFVALAAVMLLVLLMTFIPWSIRTVTPAFPSVQDAGREPRMAAAFLILLHGYPLAVTFAATAWLVRHYALTSPATPVAAGVVIGCYLLTRLAAREPSSPEVSRLRALRQDLALGRTTLSAGIITFEAILAGEPADEDITAEVEGAASRLLGLLSELDEAVAEGEALKGSSEALAGLREPFLDKGSLLLQRALRGIAEAEAGWHPPSWLLERLREADIRRVRIRERQNDLLARTKALTQRLEQTVNRLRPPFS